MIRILFAVIFVGVWVAWQGVAGAANWISYSTTDTDAFFYDKESVTAPSKDIRRIYTKTVPVDEEERQKIIAARAKLVPEKNYGGYSYTVVLEEIDCGTRECCKLSRTDFASGEPGKGEIALNRWEWGRICFDDMWMPIVPGTPKAALYKIVCAASWAQ